MEFIGETRLRAVYYVGTKQDIMLSTQRANVNCFGTNSYNVISTSLNFPYPFYYFEKLHLPIGAGASFQFSFHGARFQAGYLEISPDCVIIPVDIILILIFVMELRQH